MAEPAPVARRWVVSGQVQGVGFRWFAHRRGEQLGLVGWVKNMPNGEVEVVARGTLAAVQTFERQLWQGPSMAVVKSVEKSDIPHDSIDSKSFDVR